MKTRRIDFFATDWIEGVSDLDLGAAAVGVYIQIIAICYAKNTPTLPKEETIRKIARQFGNRRCDIVAALSKLVHCRKVTASEHEIEPNRVRAELQRAAERREKYSENGSKGGHSKALAKAKPENSSSQALASNHQPSTINHRSATSEAKPTIGDKKLDPVERTATALMEITGWRDEGKVELATLRLLTAGATEDEILAVGREIKASRQPEPDHPEAFLRACIQRLRRTAKPIAGKATPVKPAERTDPAWLEYRERRRWAIGQGYAPGDEQWPKEPPMPATESAA